MKKTALALTALAFAASALAAPHAYAAPRANNPPVVDIDVPDESENALAEAARASFAEGVRWYKRKKYNEALAAFLQAYALTKNPVVLVNLGQTNMRLGSPLNAIKYFEKFLAEAKDASAERRARVEQALAEARTQVGRIEVSAPEGAEISVDGEVVGKSPLAAPVDVLPGKHEVSMALSGSSSKTESVEVAKAAKVQIRLVPPRIAERPPPPPAARKDDSVAPEEPGLFSAPRTAAPTYVAGAIGLAALTTAIVMNGIRVNAERNADTATEALVRNGKNPGACNDPGALAADPTIGGACASIREKDRILDKTNQPFTIALWTGVGATAAALTWYFLAPKERPGASAAARTPAVRVTPNVAATGGGATVFGAF